MKKRIIGLLVSTVATAGLTVAASEAPASACDAYSGCVDTTTKAKIPDSVDQGDRAVLKVKIASSGSARPKGKVKFVIISPDGDKVVFYVRVRHGKVHFKTPKFTEDGTYTVKTVFKPRNGTVFDHSKTHDTIDVS